MDDDFKIITVTVDADCINFGGYKPHDCPVTLAVEQASGGKVAHCGFRNVSVDIGPVRYHGRFPREAQDFIKSRTGHQVVKPIQFDLWLETEPHGRCDNSKG